MADQSHRLSIIYASVGRSRLSDIYVLGQHRPIDHCRFNNIGRRRPIQGLSYIYVLGPGLSLIIHKARPIPAVPSYGGFNTVRHAQSIQDIMLGKAIYDLSMTSAGAGQPIMT